MVEGLEGTRVQQQEEVGERLGQGAGGELVQDGAGNELVLVGAQGTSPEPASSTVISVIEQQELMGQWQVASLGNESLLCHLVHWWYQVRW